MSEPQVVPSFFSRRPSGFESVATFAIIAALLYLGAGILVPLTLAILLAFALSPVVSWLSRRLRLPDAAAVIIAVILALAALIGFVTLTGMQVAKLAADLPGYQQTVTNKIAGLQNQFGGFVWLEQLNATIANLGERMTPQAQVPGEGVPVPVRISNDAGPLSLLTSVMGSIVGPVATMAIVAVFLIFLLISRADLQDRFIRLVSAGRYSLTNLAISDASSRVGRYLIIQLMVNIVYGTIFGIGLWLIGVPSALLWGMLIIPFRYIPFVGALIIAIVPFTLAFAVDPGWNMLLLSVGLFLILDLTTANAIEPRLYGSSTGVSPIAILLSAMFWATLWGPVGLILATPMTVCLVVIGRHLPQFQFLETLLGSEPVLAPAERLYQRMLKGNVEDAITIAEEHIEENGRPKFINTVMLPALQMANAELTERPEAVPQRRQLIQSFEAVLKTTFETEWPENPHVLLIGGRNEIDEAAARLLGTELVDEDIAVAVMPPGAIRQEAIGRLDLDGVKLVVLVFMGNDLRAQCRYVARRLRRMAPGVEIMACVLNPLAAEETAHTLHVDSVVRDLDTARDTVLAGQSPVLRDRRAASSFQPFAGAGRGDDALGRALEAVAEEFGMAAAVINLIDDQRHLEDEEAARLTLLVSENRSVLVVHSDKPHPQVGDNAYLQTNGIDLYAAAPLVLPDGRIAGALALVDYEPKSFTEEDIARLEQTAVDLVRRFGQPPQAQPQAA
jgi:predicted PurR-regulated permease PerM/GAF domain-containing protein